MHLELDQVMRVGPMIGLVFLHERRENRALSLFLPREDIVRRQLSASQEESPNQELSRPAP